MKIGIVGGGMMGLATAHYLNGNGVDVAILEKENEIGGLSKSVELLPDLRWDRYYHVILSTDTELLAFLDEMGLALDIQFKETRTGFFTDNALHSMSTTLEFLKFKPLSLWDKLRLGLGILYVNSVRDWNRLEKLYVKNWLTSVFGRRIYEKIWDPLLRSKFGTSKEEAAASFIWATIRRLYGTRKKTSKRELMGCVNGGYYSVLNRIQQVLTNRGVEFLLGNEVIKLEPTKKSKVYVLFKNKKSLKFDKVILTIPNNDILRICPVFTYSYKHRLESIRYLSLVCLTIVLEQPLSPFYVINLTDPGFPFTGIIEATNVVPHEILGDRGLVYLPRYMAPGDPFKDKSDEEIARIFIQGLKRVFPDFTNRNVIKYSVNREEYVQPIHELRYSEKIPPFDTPTQNVHLVNTTMISNSTLNNNRVIELAKRMARHLIVGSELSNWESDMRRNL